MDVELFKENTDKCSVCGESEVTRADIPVGTCPKHKSELFWERCLLAAEEYRRVYGSLLVPMAYVTVDGIRLGRWIVRQRRDYRLGHLSAKRRQRLEDAGMLWENDGWRMRYDMAVRYKKEHGTADIPRLAVVDGVALGRWLILQRHLYAEGTLAPEKMELMERLAVMDGR